MACCVHCVPCPFLSAALMCIVSSTIIPYYCVSVLMPSCLGDFIMFFVAAACVVVSPLCVLVFLCSVVVRLAAFWESFLQPDCSLFVLFFCVKTCCIHVEIYVFWGCISCCCVGAVFEC